MKNKIIGIVMLMLVVTTMVAATNLNVKKDIQKTAPGVDVPVWEIGDSWIFNEQYINHGYNEDILWNLWYHNCTSTYTVTDVTGDNYTVKMTSTNNEGSQIINWLRMKYTPFTKLTGEFILRKTDLSYVSYSQTEKGFVFLGIGKISPFLPGQWYDTWGGRYTPPQIVLPFPLTAGTNGTLANYSWVVHEIASFYWGLSGNFYKDYLGYSGEQNYTCEMADISVPSGTYDAYNVSIESTNSHLKHTSICSYYTAEVGWFVKQSYYYYSLNTGKPGYIYKCELISTTYTP